MLDGAADEAKDGHGAEAKIALKALREQATVADLAQRQEVRTMSALDRRAKLDPLLWYGGVRD